MLKEDRLPYIDKAVVRYLKDIYDNRYLLEICRKDKLDSSTSIGFMLGVQHIVDRLDAISTREDD